MGITGYILTAIGLSQIFKKANIESWKAFIPFYNTYHMVKLVNRSEKFFWALVIPWVLLAGFVLLVGLPLIDTIYFRGQLGLPALLPLGGLETAIATGALSFLAFIITFPLLCILQNDIAKSFGKGVGTAIGLIFLAPIFTLILGFGNATYTKIERTEKQ